MGISEGTFGGEVTRDIYWWLAKEKDKTKQLEALNNDMQMLCTDNQRQEAYETYASLYSNRRIDPGAPLLASYEARWSIDQGKYSRCPYNLMKQVIDETTSRIIKTHPRARFITHGGNRTAQRKAEYMQRWNDYQVHRLYESEKFEYVIKDASLYGLGALKFYKAYREDRVKAERCYPGNLFVDLQETMFDRPTRLHHRRFVSRTLLITLFPKFRSQIEDASGVTDESRYVSWYGHYLGAQDQVEVVESWHLPTYLEKKKEKGEKEEWESPDGVRYLWISNAILQRDEYNRRSFPFAFFNWKNDPHNTFYGTGLGEDLLGVHIDANVTLNRVNTSIEFMPSPYVLAKKGSRVAASDLTDAPGTIIEYGGSVAPDLVMPPSVPPDMLQYVREHEARAYKIAGLASAQAFGDRIPAGLETGRAVENYFQVESVPFASQLRKFEYFIQDVADNNINIGREIFEHNPEYTVVLPGDRNTIQELKWSEVALDVRENESYVIRAAPASALSELPAARMAEVERLMQMGVVTSPAVAADLMALPDLEKKRDMVSAQLDNIRKIIGLAIDKNIFTPPSPFMDLDLLIIEATAEEQKGRDMDVPEKNLSTLGRIIRRANELNLKRRMAAEMGQQGMMTPSAVPTQGTGASPTATTEGMMQ